MNSSPPLSEQQRIAQFVGSDPLPCRLKTRFIKTLRPLMSHAFSLVRRNPELIYISDNIARGGNWLYLWARAYTDRAETPSCPSYLLHAQGMQPWIEEFPALADLTTMPTEKFSFFQRRASGLPNDVENHFFPGQLNAFIKDCLLSSEVFNHRLENIRSNVMENTVVLSIRRGDYYSVPFINARYGIDTVGYVRQAVHLLQQEVTPSNFVVVSDEPQWCAENLAFLADIAPVSFDKGPGGMFEDLAKMATARWLILTNTTFGYWGSYIAQARSQAQVFVPDIHEYDPVADISVTALGSARPRPHSASFTAVHHPEGKNWITGQTQ